MSTPFAAHRPTDLAAWTDELDGTRVVFGAGAIEGLGRAARDLGLRSVLLVTDRGLRAVGHVTRAEAVLAAEGVQAHPFDDVVENPSASLVEAGRRAAEAASVDGLVAVGGGSTLDCAKGINFVLSNGGKIEDYWGRDKATRPMLPSIGVPTTAGTGSEAQRFAIISQDGTGAKMACGDPKARFRVTILDPALLSSAPKAVRSTAAIDAAAHAVESHVSRARTALSDLLSREAWRLLSGSVDGYLADAHHPAARSGMLLGSFLAGAAIEHSMLGAAHACANPLTARRHVTHGIAVGVMLPHVVRYNAADAPDRYDGLGAGSAAALSEQLDRMLRSAGLPTRLRDCGVTAEDLDPLADGAATQWTAGFNPRPVDRDALRELYAAAY